MHGKQTTITRETTIPRGKAELTTMTSNNVEVNKTIESRRTYSGNYSWKHVMSASCKLSATTTLIWQHC